MKTVKVLHRTVLAMLLAPTLLGGLTLFGMDSNLDSSDEETHELPEWAASIPDESTSNSGIWSLLESQVAGVRSLVGFGRSLFEDLLLTRHSAQTSHGTKELLTLFLTDKDAYLQLTQCLPKDMNLLIAQSLLNNLPLVAFILERLGSHCCINTLKGHYSIVNSAQFNSPRDKTVTVSDDSTAKIWDVASGKCLHTLQGHAYLICSAEFNGAGDRIVTASQDNTAKIWDVATGVCLHTLQGHDNAVCSAQFNSVGDRIVTASEDRTAKIWDVASGNCLHTLQGHGKMVCSAQFNSIGDRIVTTSFDCTAKIWDVASGKCLHTLRGHGSIVNSAHFNGAGDGIVTASQDNTAKIWDVRSLDTSTNWFKKECSLEQALLLNCIYEARIAGHGLRKLRMTEACPHLQANSDALPDPVFDFNAFPHLRECFDAMPPLIQKCLEEFVINK